MFFYSTLSSDVKPKSISAINCRFHRRVISIALRGMKTITTKKVCFFGEQKKTLFSIGGIPYERWSQSTTMKKIQEGYRLPKPEHIDDSL